MIIVENGNRNCTKNICKNGAAFKATARMYGNGRWRLENIWELSANPLPCDACFFTSRSLRPRYFEGTSVGFFWQVSPTSSFKILPRPDRKPPKPKLLQRIKQPLTEAFFLVSDVVFPGSVVRGKSMKDINVTR